MPVKPTIEAVLFTSGYFWSNLLRVSIDSLLELRDLSAERPLFADVLGTNRKLMSLRLATSEVIYYAFQ